MATAVGDLLGHPELWVGAAAALALGTWRRGIRLEVAATLAVLISAVLAQRATVPLLALPLVLGHRWPMTKATWGAIALTLAAGGAVYACVPDVERTSIVIGVTVGAAVCARAVARPWGGVAIVVTASLTWVALSDGSARGGSLTAALGIAAAHLVLAGRDHVGRPLASVITVVGCGLAWVALARGPGLEAAVGPAAIGAVGVVALSLLLARWLAVVRP